MQKNRDFVNTLLFVHKHVKIRVDKWILETTRPQESNAVSSVITSSILAAQLNWKYYFFSVDEWTTRWITRQVAEILNETTEKYAQTRGKRSATQYEKIIDYIFSWRWRLYKNTKTINDSNHTKNVLFNSLVILTWQLFELRTMSGNNCFCFIVQ